MSADETEWILSEIESAQSIERLTWLGEVIKYDADHGFEYAMMPAVEVVRSSWAKRKQHLREVQEWAVELKRSKE